MDMELTFEKTGSKFVAEFEVTGDFNLHVEKPYGKMYMSQRTAGGRYDRIDAFNGNYNFSDNSVIDYDFTALVYPKFIKIESEVEPTVAVVASDGEITEIKSQSKEVEITSNGTTEVTPDAGFAYLNSVKVKTNVPSSEGGSKVRYFNVVPVISALGRDLDASMALFAGIVAIRFTTGNDTSIGNVALVRSYSSVTHMAILPGFVGLVYNNNVETSDTVIEQFIQLGATEITEEEFYNLNA